MFWELYQTSQIHQAQSQAGRAELKSQQVEERIRLLEDKIESLALACQSLWEIVRDNTAISQEQLERKMEEVDLRDGKRDGKLSRVVSDCTNCGRKTGRRRRICIYCGAENKTDEVFGLR